MTRKEVIDELKNRFIDKFGVGVAVKVKGDICVIRDSVSGNAFISSVRYSGVQFEYWRNWWGGGWFKLTDKHIIRALSDCLGVKVESRTEYFIDGD